MEQVYAMQGSGFVNNQEFIQGFETALGNDFTSFDVRDYEWDVWLQDEIEFASLSSNGTRLDIVIDSIRNRGLDNLPEEQFDGPDTWIETWGRGMATSQDSFGNLEVAPPVDGYPYGRIYYGNWYYGNTTDSITTTLTDELNAQGLQDPFTLDVTFLCVGHVDEYMTFVPDASAPKGFKYMLADVDAGYAFLESLDPSMSLPKYANDHGFSTVGSILNDNALKRLNEDIQLDYIEPTWEIMQAELGLTENDIIRVPMLFEEAMGCQGYTATLIPSTLNMVVATNEDGTGADLIMPDPYFRSSVNNQSEDPFIEHVNALIPEGNTPHWIDDWNEYHMQLGEVHCGSNTLRTPVNIESMNTGEAQ
jgi:protein-arginine deiminase